MTSAAAGISGAAVFDRVNIDAVFASLLTVPDGPDKIAVQRFVTSAAESYQALRRQYDALLAVIKKLALEQRLSRAALRSDQAIQVDSCRPSLDSPAAAGDDPAVFNCDDDGDVNAHLSSSAPPPPPLPQHHQAGRRGSHHGSSRASSSSGHPDGSRPQLSAVDAFLASDGGKGVAVDAVGGSGASKQSPSEATAATFQIVRTRAVGSDSASAAAEASGASGGPTRSWREGGAYTVYERSRPTAARTGQAPATQPTAASPAPVVGSRQLTVPQTDTLLLVGSFVGTAMAIAAALNWALRRSS